MSCHITDMKQIERIVHALQSNDIKGNGQAYTLYNTIYHRPFEWFQRFPRLLWIANHKAYRARYNTNQSGFTVYRSSTSWPAYMAPVQLLKSMQHLAYQCNEDIPESQAVQDLNAIIDELKTVIISNLPAYEAAAWA